MKSEVKQMLMPVLNPSIDPISFQREVYGQVDVQYYTTNSFEGNVAHSGFLLLVVEFVNPFNRQPERLTEIISDREDNTEEMVKEMVLSYFEFINPR